MIRPYLFLAISLPLSALEPGVGHVEIALTYQPNTQAWSWNTDWFDNDLQLRDDPLSSLFFPGLDRFYDPEDFSNPDNLGCKWLRPPGSQWDFLGIDENEPLWIFSDTALASAGFDSTPSNLTGSLQFTLVDVSGPSNGHFALYFGSSPQVYMHTLDGIGPTDVFPKPASHFHASWAFTRKGLWIVSLKAKGTLASSGQPTVESAPQPIVFAIGELATWRATHFDMAQLQDPGISGDDADPDQDGFGNLMEFALGGHPLQSSPLASSGFGPMHPRLLRPTSVGGPWHFEYLQRIPVDDAELVYQVESTSDPASSEWNIETTPAQSVVLDDTWLRVTQPVPAASRKFLRLRVEQVSE